MIDPISKIDPRPGTDRRTRTDPASGTCTAFHGTKLLLTGRALDVALAVKALLEREPVASILTFDDATGQVVDFDLRGSATDIAGRLAAREVRGSGDGEVNSGDRDNDNDAASGDGRGRGRPKLGVVAREVTLLPRHWQWLAEQPGGASQALRRLVEAARRDDGGKTAARAAQERAYRFMAALAGDVGGFEEASRALFKGDRAGFAVSAASWPVDIRVHADRLAWGGGSQSYDDARGGTANAG